MLSVILGFMIAALPNCHATAPAADPDQNCAWRTSDGVVKVASVELGGTVYFAKNRHGGLYVKAYR